ACPWTIPTRWSQAARRGTSAPASAAASASLRPRAGAPDDRAPLLGLRGDEGAELPGRKWPRLDADAPQACQYLRSRERAAGAGVQLVDDLRRGPGARAEPDPRRRFEAGEPGFVERRHVGRRADALFLRDRDRAEPAFA